MPVDLGDLVDYVKAELIPPGDLDASPFVNATDEDWVQALANAFWTAWLAGYFRGYSEVDGIIVATTAAVDVPRGDQQLIVFFAGYNAVKAELLQLTTMSRYRAGPVEAETQRSAQVLTGLLRELRQRIEDLRRDMLLGGNTGTKVKVLDRIVAALDADQYSDRPWIRG